MTTMIPGRANARGMTLVELMIALIVFSVIVSGALTFLSRSSQAYRVGSARMEILQNLRYAAGVLATDLRTAGANLPDAQPQFVYVGTDVIAFNGDYATNVPGDAWAVYYDPDAGTGSVTALQTAQKITIPNSSYLYPSVDYAALGTNSPAELQVFFFALDGTTARSDDYILYRQVNDRAPEMVARNLLQTGNTPFFQYFRLRIPTGAPARVEPVPNGELPLIHTTPTHQSPADTGASARADSIRGVLASFTATNGLTGTRERQRSLTRLIRFPNAGLTTVRTCGDEPILGTPLVASPVVLGTGAAIRLVWNAAVDESAGETDVVRYVLWRRLAGEPQWGDPYRSIPAGNAAYQWEDQNVVAGTQYEYALAAQDCTPTQSTLVTAGPVLVP
ncbi:MAG: prepilin-type N-terminal cleavage/methylation domain-containing protein [Gemmatimonadota bacterium]|nr:prepilin-type N-terminal cleavage/methylation domain-containing protein [Gemmatimonadota bacterium]MDH5197133.1 prepilin-type N-terminal cleavage/methylation domain-containing protein [Gemmatimonadota bacterium]